MVGVLATAYGVRSPCIGGDKGGIIYVGAGWSVVVGAGARCECGCSWALTRHGDDEYTAYGNLNNVTDIKSEDF